MSSANSYLSGRTEVVKRASPSGGTCCAGRGATPLGDARSACGAVARGAVAQPTKAATTPTLTTKLAFRTRNERSFMGRTLHQAGPKWGGTRPQLARERHPG